jgi:hypothetical protein
MAEYPSEAFFVNKNEDKIKKILELSKTAPAGYSFLAACL